MRRALKRALGRGPWLGGSLAVRDALSKLYELVTNQLQPIVISLQALEPRFIEDKNRPRIKIAAELRFRVVFIEQG